MKVLHITTLIAVLCCACLQALAGERIQVRSAKGLQSKAPYSPALASEKNQGGFGLMLGAVFDPAKAVGTNDINWISYGRSSSSEPMYRVDTTNAPKAFGVVVVQITPKTQRIYRIVGASYVRWTPEEREELERVLHEKYATEKEVSKDPDGWTKIIDQGNRYIDTVTVSGISAELVSYVDTELAKLALKEAAQLKFEGKAGL